MYESKIGSPARITDIPPQVQNLASRERELASLIYSRGAMTAKAIETSLSVQLDNSSVRSMLNRLCRKRILTRRKRVHTTGCGRRIAFLYLPAIAPDSLRKTVLRQIAQDYFDGSLLLAAQATIEMIAEEQVQPAEGSRPRRATRMPNIAA